MIAFKVDNNEARNKEKSGRKSRKKNLQSEQ